MGGLRERRLLELMEALTSSLDLNQVLSGSYQVMSQLLVADYAAICVSKPGQPAAYDWAVAKMPRAFFDRYPELAGEDFVRRAVMRKPNRVLRDSEMLSREALRQSSLYRHCRELKMPLEYVMAVLLDVKSEWHGGFTLYRESKRRPFSEDERQLLQRLTPVLASTVRNCRTLAEVSEQGQLLDALFHHEGIESIVLVPPGKELMRTAHSTALVQKWFAPVELGRRGLPSVLWERLALLQAAGGLIFFGQDLWERPGPDRSLKVTFVPLPEQEGQRPWALLLQEVPHLVMVPPPREWQQKLTPQEMRVVEWMLRGVDNQSIAEQLGRSVNTVKTHLKKIYFKLAVPGRAKLILAAQELSAREGGRRGLLPQ
ncbi:LuxR C-terminal-related transcriptional regulator [Hyalangium sp.]|uniref:LuxR C-terminal-related transcriptional regulator n=1 Tax=Hyalangium sp. TaxID=2028555 RepID=UPI002D6A10C2|nr:LuxR C-terminal-related transcriptional regulator [Hyalangium sp.]HYH95780.1 LuxR C-terminal-related transcriptional regulator [Hyalangium sp.]